MHLGTLYDRDLGWRWRWQPFDVTTLRAPDGSITAKFVSFGATMTELWVRDRDGNARDVVLGYDDNVSLLQVPIGVFTALVRARD